MVGSPITRTSYTTIRDTGRALAQLSIIGVSSTASSIPQYVRVTGDNKSYEELKKLFEDEGGKKIELKKVEVEDYRSSSDPNDLYAELRYA